ncbi:DUF3107 domain-containing protein [Nocardioides sp. CFH 31398]|uniref:DUF3107 domain-containing protein n=1 Tax=Nocardioides sp. CFH 31398 TaxID=2919579 RepID=UPI001F061A57|nr:DUF3107 domain-containing protein [Nocardioides sp. CFH 31398]MCH1866488.1 DUF3107 domain-containing protein [Nocardioides sp. CFH 31398]
MDVKIGIRNAPRELSVDLEVSAEELQKQVADAVASSGVLTLTDTKGRTVLVPAGHLAYVEIGSQSQGTVGFRS